ncbi:MAG: DNA repair protein RecO [Phycisphaerales bacterium]
MPMVEDEGICVRHWDWSETSQTVAVMTREHGLVRCLAKGSKREKAPFSGGVELLMRAELGMIIKPSADLATLTSWDLIEPMPSARAAFARYAACMYIADLIPRAVHDHDPHPVLFEALANTLAAIGGVESCDIHAVHAWLSWFQWQVLAETGSKPEVLIDVRTGEDLKATQPVGFAWELGGLTAMDRHGQDKGVARISPTTVGILRRLDAGEAASELTEDADANTRAGCVLAARLRDLFTFEPPTLSWVYPQIAGQSQG